MISLDKTVKTTGVSERFVKTVAASVFRRLKDDSAIVGVHFIGDKRMCGLNFHHRGLNRPTDVLAFALRDGDKFADKKDWGDIFLCVPQIRRQAKRFRVSYREELSRMLIHGLLHLAGYDHERKEDANVMFSLQEELLFNII
ncbi:MAG: rRNA maturation RNase YbeY [Patescibacteria group bacterium]